MINSNKPKKELREVEEEEEEWGRTVLPLKHKKNQIKIVILDTQTEWSFSEEAQNHMDRQDKDSLNKKRADLERK